MESIRLNLLILEKLKEKERSIAWLARQVGYDKDNLRKILKNNQEIYPNLLLRISVALKEDFFAYYSQNLKERLNAQKTTETD